MVSMRSRRPSVDKSIPAEKAAAAVGGAKTIGLVGGVALLINNITGSAMVLFPSLYQAAGWLLVSIALFAVAGLSYVCAIMIIEAMAAMPGNAKFSKRVEYTTLAYFYLGKYGYGVTQFFFQMSLAFNNISSIIQSVQVMDFALVAIFGKACSVPEFYPNFRFGCMEAVQGDITVFGSIYVLSVGFILTAVICAPLGFWNLDDNIIIQKVSCSIVCLLVMTWCGIFISQGLEAARVPVIGTQFTNVLGTTVFNFAVITSIPSWVNEKREKVSILATMGVAMPMALGLFSLIGIVGGMAYVPWFNTPDADQTLLNKLQNSSLVLAKLTFYLFPVVVNLTSIPVFAIMQRYNLLEAEVCGPRMANFLGVVLPWLICVPFMTGSGFSNVVNWGGIIFNSTVNFIIPPLIYISMVRRQQIAAEKHVERDIRLLVHPVQQYDSEADALEAEDRFDEDQMYIPPGTIHTLKPMSPSPSLGAPSALAASLSSDSFGAGAAGGETSLNSSSFSSTSRGNNPKTLRVQQQVQAARAARREERPLTRGPRSFDSRATAGGGGGGGGGAGKGKAMLGAKSVGFDLGTRESLLGDGDEDSMWDPSEVDERSAAEEAKELRILGYDVHEAERREEREREKAVRLAAQQLQQHKGHVTMVVGSVGDPSRHVQYAANLADDGSAHVSVIDLPAAKSMSHGPAVMSPEPVSPLTEAQSMLVVAGVAPEAWQAMPLWLLPHRIALAKAVAVSLTLCALGVIALNIYSCATGQGC